MCGSINVIYVEASYLNMAFHCSISNRATTPLASVLHNALAHNHPLNPSVALIIYLDKSTAQQINCIFMPISSSTGGEQKSNFIR